MNALAPSSEVIHEAIHSDWEGRKEEEKAQSASAEEQENGWLERTEGGCGAAMHGWMEVPSTYRVPYGLFPMQLHMRDNHTLPEGLWVYCSPRALLSSPKTVVSHRLTLVSYPIPVIDHVII